MAEKDFFSYSLNYFKFLRIWSYREGENKTLLARFLQCMVLVSVYIVLIIIALSDAIEEIRHGDTTEVYIKVLLVVAFSVCTQKIATIAVADYDINACIRQMERMSCKFKDTSDIEKSLRIYKRMFVVGLCAMIVCSFVYTSAPLATDDFRPLRSTPYLPYLNVVKTPNWHLIFIYEVFALTIMSTSTIANDTLFCGLLCVSSGIISSICREIRELEDTIEDHQISVTKLKEIIDKINETRQLTTKISDLFSLTTMTHMLYNCSSLTMGLFAVSVLPFSDLTCMILILITIVLVFQLWIYCYFGQDVVNQREILERELYFIRWYETSKSFKTILIITILEAQKDRYIYAAKVVPLSLETFTEVIKKAYMFFTFLSESR